MYLDKKAEKKWLIKSENKILGPYSFDQIVDLLRKKQISIIDEVRDPETRWLYVRENNEFKNIVEEIRKEIDSRQESTKTYQSATSTLGGTSTQNLQFEEQAQKTKTDIPLPTSENIEVEEAEIVNETKTVLQESVQAPKVEKAKIYGVVSDAAVQNQITDYSKRLKIAVAAVAVAVIASYGGFLIYQKRNVLKKEEEMVLQVKRLKYLGLHERAVEIYATLPAEAQKNLTPALLDIFPLLEKNKLMDLDDIKTLQAKIPNLTPEQRANIELIFAWSAAKKLNFGQAQDHISNALKAQGASALARENDAWLALKRSQPKPAYKQFNDLQAIEKNGRYIFGEVVSYLAMPTQDRESYGRELLKDLERYTLSFFDLQKELLLAQIYIALELKEQEIFRISLEHFFNTPPQLSKYFLKPQLLIPDTYKWKALEAIKNSVYEKLSGDEAILFQMHDYLEQEQLNAASKYLQANLSRVSSPAVKAQLNLLLQSYQDRHSEVLALAASGTLDEKSKLTNFLIAMSNIRKDPTVNINNLLFNIDTKSDEIDLKGYKFYSNWLRLEQYKARNDIEKISSFLKDNFITTEDFVPVLEARNMVN